MAGLSPRKHPRRRWLLRLVIGVGLALLTFEAAFQYRWRSVQAERDALIAQVRDAGEPVYWVDLEKPQTEGSKALRQALDTVVRWELPDGYASPVMVEAWTQNYDERNASAEHLILLHTERIGLQLLERAVDLPPGPLTEEFTVGSTWTKPVTSIYDARECLAALSAASMNAVGRAAPRDAYRALIVQLKLARAFAADPSGQIHFSRLANIALHHLYGVLPAVDPTPTETTIIDSHLAASAASSARAPLSVLRAMAMTPLESPGDLTVLQFWNGIEVRRPTWASYVGLFRFAAGVQSFYGMRWGRPAALEEQATLLRTTAEAQAAIDDVGPEADRRWEEMNRRHTEEIERCLWLRCLRYPESWTAKRRSTLRLRRDAILAQYALRVNQYRIRNGRLPASVDEAATEISPLESSPFFAGGRPTYRRDGNGFVLGEAVAGDEPPNDGQRSVFRVTYQRTPRR